jgi:hypothetical protein
MTPTPNRTCVSTKSQNTPPTMDPQNSNKEKPDTYNKTKKLIHNRESSQRNK